jgi:hypothetical protein
MPENNPTIDDILINKHINSFEEVKVSVTFEFRTPDELEYSASYVSGGLNFHNLWKERFNADNYVLDYISEYDKEGKDLRPKVPVEEVNKKLEPWGFTVKDLLQQTLNNARTRKYSH